MLDFACQIVDAVRDKEQWCMDNLLENLQEFDRYYRMEETVDNLESGTDQISNMKDLIEKTNMVSVIIAFALLFFLAIRGFGESFVN